MKSTIDDNGTETDAKRGLFRRGKRSSDHPVTSGSADANAPAKAVTAVDDITRRIDELAAGSTSAAAEADAAVRAALEMQRAAIARANDAASTTGAPRVAVATGAPHVTNVPPQPVTNTPEAPVQQTTTTTQVPTEPHFDEVDDIEARMDAVLAPAPLPSKLPGTVAQPSVQLNPTPAPTQQRDTVAAEMRPVNAGAQSAAPTASSLLGIDIERMVRLIEDEALATRQRIELEVRSAHTQSTEIIDRAEGEAERIREHGQAQARVLLGEVEEIISEAQQTGEQILTRANEEASNLRGEATSVLQQAQTEARAIVETARREGEQVLAEQRRLATVRAQEAMREQDRLKDQIRRLEERRRQVLESLEPLISQLTQMMPAGVTEPNVVHLDRTRG